MLAIDLVVASFWRRTMVKHDVLPGPVGLGGIGELVGTRLINEGPQPFVRLGGPGRWSKRSQRHRPCSGMIWQTLPDLAGSGHCRPVRAMTEPPGFAVSPIARGPCQDWAPRRPMPWGPLRAGCCGGDDRADPPAGPSEGTLDSVEPAGASMTGSDDRTRGDEPSSRDRGADDCTGAGAGAAIGAGGGHGRRGRNRRDAASHDEHRNPPRRVRKAGRLRSTTPGVGGARSGPVLSGPSSISLPGLKMFPTSGVGPSSSVERKDGAERKGNLPRRGFQFPDLRLKSTRRLAERRREAKNCNFFFQAASARRRSLTGNSYQTLLSLHCPCKMIPPNGIVPTHGEFSCRVGVTNLLSKACVW